MVTLEHRLVIVIIIYIYDSHNHYIYCDCDYAYRATGAWQVMYSTLSAARLSASSFATSLAWGRDNHTR